VCAPVPFYHCFGCVLAVLGSSTHGAVTGKIQKFRMREMAIKDLAL
jgi:hypothetical protein